tara:strand:+ start:9447 stop:13031 length:3585 start_codon:yes stop_codon:yes gene_type:complete
MRPRPLDPFAVPLKGVNLVEAAAGTGKTWTITLLYLRLLLEQDLPVANILVVTYTRAATGELRQRLRDALIRALEAFRSGDGGGDPLVAPLLAAGYDATACVLKLRRAVADFDQAGVFTIHAFCERVLSDSAFQSGMALDTELMANDEALLAEVTDDLWRKEIYPASACWVNWLCDVQKLHSADDLRKHLRPLIGKPFIAMATTPDADDLDGHESALADAFRDAADCWKAHRDEVCALLTDPESGLNRNRYPPRSMPTWIRQLDAMFSESFADFGKLKAFAGIRKLTSGFLATPKAVRKGAKAPAHVFFDRVDTLVSQADAYQEAARSRFINWLEEMRLQADAAQRKLKVQRGVQAYDDLLLNLNAALDSDHAGALMARLRTDYQAALLDEFQDTDPVQYEIFRTVYGDGTQPVFMVGDPKQTIYSFRGADIFAYLKARESATARYTLDTNHRATPELVAAVNALFSARGRETSFVYEAIPFADAVSAASAPVLKDPDCAAPMVVWTLARAESDSLITKGTARDQGSAAVAAEIQRLYDSDVMLGDRPLRPQDIAVLVRNHSEGMIVQQALAASAIPSVRQGHESVFETFEAMELERVLQAIAQPRREPLLRAALLTDLMGIDVAELLALEKDSARWDGWLARFHQWHERWRQNGFMRMFREFAAECDVLPRVAGLADGERRLTNLLHLAECVAAGASRYTDIPAVLNWLAAVRQEPPPAEESTLLRLESDEDRVCIVTIHASKGLQYPVVFVPFAWDGALKTQRLSRVFFHDRSAKDGFRADFGSAKFELHKARAKEEELAENLRLLYVALTRAQSRCYLAFGAVNGSTTSALAWLLYRPQRKEENQEVQAVDHLASHFKTLGDDDLDDVLAELAEASGATVAIRSMPDSAPAPAETRRARPERLTARQASRQISRSWQMGSFSSLSTGHDSTLPDYDPQVQPGAADGERSFFTFPRGARAGTCLHRIFELIDFRDDSSAGRSETVRQVLGEYGFEDDWTPVINSMLQRVLSVPLNDEGLHLGTLARRERVDEMAFCYPVDGLDAPRWRDVLSRHAQGLHPAIATGLNNAGFDPLKGFMRGFIDLVFVSGGKFFLADYKSNYLGRDFSDYGGTALDAAMHQSAYTLQYLIYSLALHRWLRSRIDDYHYDQHFGGVYYLFLRGMHPDHPGSGVFFDRAEGPLVADLDALVGGNP